MKSARELISDGVMHAVPNVGGVPDHSAIATAVDYVIDIGNAFMLEALATVDHDLDALIKLMVEAGQASISGGTAKNREAVREGVEQMRLPEFKQWLAGKLGLT